MKPQIQPIERSHWLDLFVCALSVAAISMYVNVQNSAGIVIVTSFASSALAIMVAPKAPTNSVRAVLISYLLAAISPSIGDYLISNYLTTLNSDEAIFTFLKFFLLLFITLTLFGLFDAYHPPSIGAMLTYLIEPNLSSFDLLSSVLISVIFLLFILKPYTYYRNPQKLQWKNFSHEFTREYGETTYHDDEPLNDKNA